jgi:hypothetical protein
MTMTLSGDGTITGLVAGGLPDATITTDELAAGAALNNAPNSVGFRNRIINGDMRIDQRNAGALIVGPTNGYTLDRWYCREGGTGAIDAQQSTTAANGFTNSLVVTVTTTNPTPAATDRTIISQRIEGYNVADLNWGSANAKSITVSFYVRASVTGLFGGAALNSAADRSYVFNYTISAANTWEYKTVTIPGDTTGTWEKGNGIGVWLVFSCSSGSTYTATPNSWGSGQFYAPTGQTNLMATNGATWYITGVQLEVGSVATPFERRPFGTELALCQRYFVKFGGNVTDEAIGTFGTGASATTSRIYVPLPVSMRAAPSVSSSTLELIDSVNPAIAVSSVAVGSTVTGPLNGFIVATVASGLTTFRPYALRVANSLSGHLSYSAEL